MRFVYTWAFLASLWAASGCAASWPDVRGHTYPDLVNMGGVRSVEILPPDIELAVAEGVNDAPDMIAARFADVASDAMATAVARRGYVTSEEPDAVLELGGFAYAGEKENTAAEIAAAVVMLVLIVGIVALLAASKGGGRGHGGGGGGVHASGPRFAHVGFRVGASVALHSPWPSPPPGQIPANGSSHADLELRLIDRETGRLLWRAAADMPADPRNPEDVAQAVARLAATLPLAGRP